MLIVTVLVIAARPQIRERQIEVTQMPSVLGRHRPTEATAHAPRIIVVGILSHDARRCTSCVHVGNVVTRAAPPPEVSPRNERLKVRRALDFTHPSLFYASADATASTSFQVVLYRR